jgi:excisionase family DNA binding protein
MPPTRPPTAAPSVVRAVKTVDQLSELARVRDVADLLDCSVGTIYSLVKEGKLSGVRLGRLLRVRRDSVAALVHG